MRTPDQDFDALNAEVTALKAEVAALKADVESLFRAVNHLQTTVRPITVIGGCRNE